MDNFRIAVVAPFPLSTDYGSSVRVVNELMLLKNAVAQGYISESNFEIDIFSYDVSPTYVNYLSDMDNIRLRFISALNWCTNAYRMGFNFSRVFLDSFLIGSFLRGVKKYKYVHMHTIIPMIYFYNLTKLHLLNTRQLAVDVHGIISYEVGDKKISEVVSKIENEALKMTGTIIVNNVVSKRFIEDILGKSYNIKMLPDAVDTRIFNPLKESIVRKLRRKNDLNNSFVILYVGSFTEVQGVDKLIESFEYVAKELSNSKLLLVGGRWSYPVYKMYKKKCVRKFGKRIIVKPSVNYIKGLNNLINLADVTVSPKMPSTQGNQKILVYAAVGKPIVVYKTMTNYTILREYGFYANEINAESLAETIMKAYDALTLKKFRSEEQIKYIRENYSLTSHSLMKTLARIMNEL
ncbi:MAG: glycosyltransferase family 4 protein [Candidatus Methanomethylicia archaeon]